MYVVEQMLMLIILKRQVKRTLMRPCQGKFRHATWAKK